MKNFTFVVLLIIIPFNFGLFFNPLLHSQELIVNGNFSNGNTGFKSDYQYKTSEFEMGCYSVVKNPSLMNTGFEPCWDHTQDDAKMMLIIDGSIDSDKVIWETTVNVKKNTLYNFSFWVTKLTDEQDSELEISVNGEILKSPFNVGKHSCTWSEFKIQLNSKFANTANIKIKNLTTFSVGNDLAFDDISFKRDKFCGEEFDIDLGDNINVCPGQSVKLGNENGQNPEFTYEWTPSTFLSSSTEGNPVCTPDYSLQYTVIISKMNTGCIAYDTIKVNVVKPIKPEITAGSPYICDEPVLLSGKEGFSSYQWSTGETTREISVTLPGEYKLTVLDTNGCSSENSIDVKKKTINVNIPEEIDFGKICFDGLKTVQLVQVDNLTSDSINIDSFELQEGNDFFNVSNNDLFIEPDLKTIFSIQIKDNLIGKYNGILKIVLKNKCENTFLIPIKAEIIKIDEDFKDSISVCDGTPVNIGVINKNPEYEYLWSPAEFLDDPSSNNPVCTTQDNIRYYVNITEKSSGCNLQDSVYINVFKSDLKITSSAENICNSSVILEANEGFTDYVWSTGEKKRIIEITDGGNYTVTAVDSNGCSRNSNINIGYFRLDSLLPEKLNMGDICLGVNPVLSAFVSNKYNSQLLIDTMFIENEKDFELLFNGNNSKNLSLGEIYLFDVKANFTSTGLKEANLVLRISLPCTTEFKFKISANILNNIISVSIPDTIGIIGETLCLPVIANTECHGSELSSDYKMSVSVNKTVFKPESVARGNIISVTEENNNYIIEIQDTSNSQIINNIPSVLNYVCGRILIGENKTFPVIAESLNMKEGVGINAINGSLTINNCAFPIRHIQHFLPTNLSIVKNDSRNTLVTKTSGSEQGTYNIYIRDVTGNLISSHTWEKFNNTFEEHFYEFNQENMSSGLYFIILKSPWYVISDKILITK